LSTCAWIDTSSAATASSRDADARALAAAELVRIPPHQRRIEADAIEQQAYVLDLLPRVDEAMRDRRLSHDVHDAHAGIERRIRVLEDHLHLELLLASRRRGQPGQGLAAPEALAARHGKQSHGDAAQGGFSAPRLADEADDLAGRYREVHVVHRVNDFLPDFRAEDVADPRRRVESLDEALGYAAKLDERVRCERKRCLHPELGPSTG
jgi:hypothetical protein